MNIIFQNSIFFKTPCNSICHIDLNDQSMFNCQDVYTETVDEKTVIGL